MPFEKSDTIDTIDTNASAKEKKVTINGNYAQYSN